MTPKYNALKKILLLADNVPYFNIAHLYPFLGVKTEWSSYNKLIHHLNKLVYTGQLRSKDIDYHRQAPRYRKIYFIRHNEKYSGKEYEHEFAKVDAIMSFVWHYAIIRGNQIEVETNVKLKLKDGKYYSPDAWIRIYADDLQYNGKAFDFFLEIERTRKTGEIVQKIKQLSDIKDFTPLTRQNAKPIPEIPVKKHKFLFVIADHTTDVFQRKNEIDRIRISRDERRVASLLEYNLPANIFLTPLHSILDGVDKPIWFDTFKNDNTGKNGNRRQLIQH